MNNIKILAILLLTLTFGSCDDFLTKYPDTAIPEEEAMQNLDDASKVVLGIYSTFKDPSLYSGDMILTQDIQADYVYAVRGFSNNFGEAYRWDVRPTTTFVNSVYSGLYYIASRCNFFMDYKNVVEETLTTDAEREEYNSRLGDVHFARALAYADLIRVYCEAYDPAKANEQLGIALSTSYVNSEELLLRSSLKESYEFVLEDLAAAERLIKREGADAAYFTQGAVWALKSRVYLYMHEWEKAKEYAQKVIDAPHYELADATQYVTTDPATNEPITEYDLLWRYDQGKEIIWKVAMSSVDKGGSLGRVFLNYNSNAFYPDYIPGAEVLKMFSNDARYNSFFVRTETGYGFEATIFRKYPGNANIDAGIDKFFVNMPKVLRLSEVYLILAEAAAMLGQGDVASKALADLRAKRFVGGGSGIYDAAEALKQVKEERYKELMMEGFRLSDLKRWGEGFERKLQSDYVLDGEKEAKLKVSEDRVEFTWPIPQHDIDASGGLLQGNPSNFK